MIRAGWAAALLAAAVTVSGHADAGAAACGQPYPPVYVETTDLDAPPEYRRQVFPDHPVQRPTAIEGLARTAYTSSGSLDMDGDGTEDDIVNDPSAPDLGDPNTIRRGDGDLVLFDQGRYVTVNAGLGDLDGDGHDEAMATSYRDDPEDDRTYVVPGTTAVGTVELADVAIRIPGTAVVTGIGDLIDGPGEDAVVDTDARQLVDGSTLLAPGPGGVLDAFPTGVELPGTLLAILPVDGRMRLIGGDAVRGLGTSTGWIWEDGVLTTFAGLPEYTRWEEVGAFRWNGALHLDVGEPGQRGPSGSRTYWNLDDPCASLPALPGDGAAPGAAAPAEPVAADPTFTG